jgi:myosin heavy subunit
MSSKPNSKKESPPRFSTPNKAKGLISPRGPHDPRNSESSMNSVNNFTTPKASKPRSFEEISADPGFKKQREQFRKSVRALRTPNSKARRQLFSVPEDESRLIISGPASKISVSNIAKQANAESESRAREEASRRQIQKGIQEYREASRKATTRSKQEASRRQIQKGIQEYREAQLRTNTGPKATQIKAIEEQARANAESEAKTKAAAQAKADARAKAERESPVPMPPNVLRLFNNLDARSDNLSQNDQRKLQRAHSMANSVMSYSNTNPTKVQTMYNVQNNLQQLQSKLNSKVKASTEQLKVISKLEKELEREKEKHARATALIKEFKMDAPVPITKIVKNTTEINKLTKEMEKLKKGGDLNRSRLLGQIVSLAKKQRAAMAALSNMKTMTVTKNKNVTEMKRKLKEYATAVEKYEARIKELSKTTKATQTKKPVQRRLFDDSNSRKPASVSTSTNNLKTPTRRITVQTNKQLSQALANGRAREKGGRGRNGGGGRRKGLLTPKRLTFNNINEKIKTSKKRTELERKLELKNYITKSDFNKLVEKLDKPRTPSKEQLTKNNIAEMLKPLLNKKEKQPKFSLFGALGDINKKKLASKKPESIARAVANKFRKEIVEKIKPRTPRVSHSKSRPHTPHVSHSKNRPNTPRVYTRTPTTGQRKKHVIELIDRVLRRMKVRKDIEKKLIKFYESLSERHIKQLFGGRTREEVRSIIKKQVAYFSKKR